MPAQTVIQLLRLSYGCLNFRLPAFIYDVLVYGPLEEEKEGFHMLRPVNKTDHMQQGISVLACDTRKCCA